MSKTLQIFGFLILSESKIKIQDFIKVLRCINGSCNRTNDSLNMFEVETALRFSIFYYLDQSDIDNNFQLRGEIAICCLNASQYSCGLPAQP